MTHQKDGFHKTDAKTPSVNAFIATNGSLFGGMSIVPALTP